MKAVGPGDYANLVQLFHERAAQFADAPLLHASVPGGWRRLSWREVAQAAAEHAAGLAELGVGRGARVLLVSENCPEWLIADIAVLALGAILVPGYATSTPQDWLQLADDSTPQVGIVSQAVLQRLRPQLAQFLQRMPRLVVIGDEAAGLPGVVPWRATRRAAAGVDLKAQADAIALDDTACIMYTSGTGGRPRGVETTHRNILANCLGAASNLAAYGLEHNRFLAFLPFSHTYAHTGDLWTPLSIGAQVFLSRGTDHLAGEFQSARPTMMNTVPRFWEVMYKRIGAALAREHRVKRALFGAALATGARRLRGERLAALELLLDRIAERTVRAKVRARFGGALRCALSAGAPLNSEISVFFNALGIRLHQAYGQSECAPGITMNVAGRIVPGTVGPPMAGMRVRIAADGEILAQGENVMKGYWNDAAASAEVLADGWLHTGDVGMFDGDGNLVITDRKRDFMKTAGGEMVAPQSVEQALLLQGAIAQAMVCGDARPYLTALVVPSDELRAEHQAGRVARGALERAVGEAVAAANRALPAPMRVRRYSVLERPFEIDTGLLTPTLKLRRRMVSAAYASEIEAMYAGA